MAQVTCVECDASVQTTDDVEVGEVLSCDDCGVELEVTSVDPVEVEVAPEVEEDWGE